MSSNTVKDNRTSASGNSAYNANALMISNMIGQIHTAEVVKITAVEKGGANGPAGYVTVQPLVMGVDSFDNTVDTVDLFKLPYFRHQCGKVALIFDPEPGDIGLAVYTKKDSSGVEQGQNEPVKPGSFRTFDQANGFYLGGFLNSAPETYIEGTQDNEITIEAPETTTINTKGATINASDGCTINTNACEINAPTTTINGNVQIMGNIAWSGTGTGIGGGPAVFESGIINRSGGLTNTGGINNTGGTTTSNGIVVESHVHGGVERGTNATDGPR